MSELTARTIEMYTLPSEATTYLLSRKFDKNEKLTSQQFPGFELALAEVFAKEE